MTVCRCHDETPKLVSPRSIERIITIIYMRKHIINSVLKEFTHAYIVECIALFCGHSNRST
jgi:hypothetical protein